MEPFTINFDGLSEFATQFGPLGYVFGHLAAAMFFGIIAWRNIFAAGICHGNNCPKGADEQQNAHQQQMQGNAHVARSVVSGIIGVVNVVIVIVMSAQLFMAALEKATQVASSE